MTERTPIQSGALRRRLAVAALVALAWTGYEVHAQKTLGAALHRPPAAPRGGISLQLAASADEAQTIRNAWACAGQPPGCTDVTGTAKAAFESDSHLIAAYTLALLLTLLWATVAVSPDRRFVILIAILVVGGATCDLMENWCIGVQLGAGAGAPFGTIARLVPGLAAFSTILDRTGSSTPR